MTINETKEEEELRIKKSREEAEKWLEADTKIREFEKEINYKRRNNQYNDSMMSINESAKNDEGFPNSSLISTKRRYPTASGFSESKQDGLTLGKDGYPSQGMLNEYQEGEDDGMSSKSVDMYSVDGVQKHVYALQQDNSLDSLAENSD